jgi:hypothetical protein
MDSSLIVYFSITGTAENGLDYQHIPDSVIFKKGDSKVYLPIVPLPDKNEENKESVVIKLLPGATGNKTGYTTNPTDSAVIIISDFIPEDTLKVTVLLNPFSWSDNIQDKLKYVFSSQNSLLYQQFIQLVNSKNGTIISVYSSRPLRSLSNDSVFGKGVIYDAVGNKIKELEIKDIGTQGYYGVYWDGTNKNFRRVGTGTYLLQLIFTTVDGGKRNTTSKIGVKR